MVTARLTGLAAALPPSIGQRELWDGYFAARHPGDALAERLWLRSGVERRGGVVDPRAEDVSTWSTAARMRRYAAEAGPLAKRAVGDALADARVDASDVGLLVVASCTGYATPGVDLVVARDLGLRPEARRLFVGHMGCYAAVPGLAVVAEYVVRHRRPAVLLCVELPSLHVQPAESCDVPQLVAHALFADAAAAAVVVPADGAAPAGFDVGDVASRTDVTALDHMSWEITDHGFRMGLSPRVPAVLGRHVVPAVRELLGPSRTRAEDVHTWAVHPGGPRIVDVVAARLRLPERAVAASRAVLREHGNCSSATVLLVLDEIRRRGVPPGRPVGLLAFGPGLTLYGALLHRAG